MIFRALTFFILLASCNITVIAQEKSKPKVWYSTSIVNYANESAFMLYFGARGGISQFWYRYPPAESFTDRGFTNYRHPQTGDFMPNLSVTLPFSEWRRRAKEAEKGLVPIEVKYKDEEGVMRGPYTIPFDGRNEMVASVKAILNQVPDFVAVMPFREKMLVYFSNLLSHDYALKEIRYSFGGPENWLIFPIAANKSDQQYYVPLPPGAAGVHVQLVYINDEVSKPYFFPRPDSD